LHDLGSGAIVRCNWAAHAGRHPAQFERVGFLKVSALGVEEERVNVVIDFAEPRRTWGPWVPGHRTHPDLVCAGDGQARLSTFPRESRFGRKDSVGTDEMRLLRQRLHRDHRHDLGLLWPAERQRLHDYAAAVRSDDPSTGEAREQIRGLLDTIVAPHVRMDVLSTLTSRAAWFRP
jgi:hypothetical protein